MHTQLMIGLQGLQLSEQEKAWLRDKPPLGVILFSRNIESSEQVKALLSEVRAHTGQETWAAIDEEGGRVNRMLWEPFSGRKHAAEYGRMFALDAKKAMLDVFEDTYQVGCALKALGFTHNCAPVLDVFVEGGDNIIGERSYGSNVEIIAALAGACTHGLQTAGIEAVGKHFPGHGRADADSHLAVPVVDVPLETLLEEANVFELLIPQDLRHIMTAHIVYSAADKHIATFSSYWLKDVLRKRFSFQGKIWSDDLCMKGAGSDVKQAAELAQHAGCDVLLVCDPEGVASIYA